MNEPIVAKFNLQYNMSLKDYIEDKFIDNNLFPDIIESKYEEVRDNYADQVVEELEQIFVEIEYDEEFEHYIHPDSGDPVDYESWDDLWYDERENIAKGLLEDFLQLIRSEIEKEYYKELYNDIYIIIDNYLEESLEYDFPR